MNLYRQFGIMLLTGALLLAGFAGQALALTAACTSIENKATLTFNYGGGDIILESSEAGNTTVGADNGSATIFNVATKVDLTVTGGAIVPTVPGATDKVLTFSVTNTGNDSQRYSLRLWAAANGYDYANNNAYVDNFGVSNVRVYMDDDNTYGNASPGEMLVDENGDTVAAIDGSHLGYTANVVGNNGVIYVHVVADIPNSSANGDDAIYALQAVTHQITGRNGMNGTANGTVDGGETDETYSGNFCGSAIVLADGQVTGTGPGGAGPGSVTDAANDGDSFAVGVYTVSSAAITVTKAQETLWDPVNGVKPNAKPIPGAYVTYTMTIANNGTSSANLSSIIDDLQDDLDFDYDFFTGGDMTPVDGPYTHGAAGRSVTIDHGGTSDRPDSYGTGDDSNADGVEYTGNPGGVLTVHFTDPAAKGTVMPAGTWNSKLYTEGELKTGESVAISFNVIIK